MILPPGVRTILLSKTTFEDFFKPSPVLLPGVNVFNRVCNTLIKTEDAAESAVSCRTWRGAGCRTLRWIWQHAAATTSLLWPEVPEGSRSSAAPPHRRPPAWAHCCAPILTPCGRTQYCILLCLLCSISSSTSLFPHWSPSSSSLVLDRNLSCTSRSPLTFRFCRFPFFLL